MASLDMEVDRAYWEAAFWSATIIVNLCLSVAAKLIVSNTTTRDPDGTPSSTVFKSIFARKCFANLMDLSGVLNLLGMIIRIKQTDYNPAHPHAAINDPAISLLMAALFIVASSVNCATSVQLRPPPDEEIASWRRSTFRRFAFTDRSILPVHSRSSTP